MRSSSFRDEEAMISRKPGMAQGTLRNPDVPRGEGSKPAQVSEVQEIPTLTVFSSGLGSLRRVMSHMMALAYGIQSSDKLSKTKT